jgi:hypothetical protein
MLPTDTPPAMKTSRKSAAFVWKEWLVPPILFPLLLAVIFVAYVLLRTPD